MRDDLPWVIGDPVLVAHASGLVNPITLSYLIALCVLTQSARPGRPGHWNPELVFDGEPLSIWMLAVSELISGWSNSVCIYLDNANPHGALPSKEYAACAEVMSIPPTTVADILEWTAHSVWLSTIHAQPYYENTLSLEHIFGSARAYAGGNAMTAASGLNALGKIKLTRLIRHGRSDTAEQLSQLAKESRPLADRSMASSYEDSRSSADMEATFQDYHSAATSSSRSSMSENALVHNLILTRAAKRSPSPAITDICSNVDTPQVQDMLSRLVFALTVGEQGKPDSWRPQAGAQRARCQWLVDNWATYPAFTAQPRVEILTNLTKIALHAGRWSIGELARFHDSARTALRTASQKDGLLQKKI